MLSELKIKPGDMLKEFYSSGKNEDKQAMWMVVNILEESEKLELLCMYSEFEYDLPGRVDKLSYSSWVDDECIIWVKL
jgi:hypothetical protein